jgi:hypothetical protein
MLVGILSAMVVLLVALFIALQGAVVFGTAYLVVRSLNGSHWSEKIVAMSISYIVWIALTVSGYSLSGGEGGIMDGGLIVLMLCFTALISSFVYLLAWLFLSGRKARESDQEVLIEPWA